MLRLTDMLAEGLRALDHDDLHRVRRERAERQRLTAEWLALRILARREWGEAFQGVPMEAPPYFTMAEEWYPESMMIFGVKYPTHTIRLRPWGAWLTARYRRTWWGWSRAGIQVPTRYKLGAGGVEAVDVECVDTPAKALALCWRARVSYAEAARQLAVVDQMLGEPLGEADSEGGEA